MSCTNVAWSIRAAGDAVRRRVTIDRTASGVPAGVTISKAWLTVKAVVADVDPGIFQKEITTSDAPGTGQIEDDGTGDVDFVVRFDLTRADTLAIGTLAAAGKRYFDVQVIASDGNPYTAEIGRVYCCSTEITQAVS